MITVRESISGRAKSLACNRERGGGERKVVKSKCGWERAKNVRWRPEWVICCYMKHVPSNRRLNGNS